LIDYNLLYHSGPDCIRSAVSEEEKRPSHWIVEQKRVKVKSA